MFLRSNIDNHFYKSSQTASCKEMRFFYTSCIAYFIFPFGMQKILVSGSVAYDTVIHVAEAFVDNILPEKLSALSV